MKKISFIALLFIAFVCLNSCEENILKENGTPSEDLTKLWPAQTDTSELWGYINERGEMVIPAQFKKAYRFSCGRAKVVLDNDCQAFIDGDKCIRHIVPEGEKCDDYFYYGYCRFSNSTGLYGMYDTNFNIAIPNEYTSLGRMSKEGLVIAEKGYINKEGEAVLSLPYKSLGDFYDGVAIVTTWTDVYEEDYYGSTHYRYYKDGVINTHGKLVIDTIYDRLYSIGGNRLAYYKNGGFGLLDTRGNVITDPMFYSCYFYGDGDIMPVCRGNRWMYVDRNGKMVFPELYLYAEPFYEGVACVTLDYMKEGCESQRVLINRQGKVIFSLEKNQYWETSYHNGLCLIREYTYEEDAEHYGYKEEYKYIDKKGNTVYSWITRSENYYYSPDANKTKKELSEDEMLLKHFEGTEYYPLAEQCVRNKQMRENLKK